MKIWIVTSVAANGYSGSCKGTYACCIASRVDERCPSGQYWNALESECIFCTPGKYATGGSTICSDCVGGYSNQTGASACSWCIAGKASSVSGATSESEAACLECPPGKYSAASSPLRHFSERVSWVTAQSSCRELGGQLATPENPEEEHFFGEEAWLGLNDREQEGTWVTPAGALPSYTNWCEGEPNDAGGEDCGVMSGDCWNDLPCDHTAPYACRFDASGPTTCSDCVGGYSDKSGASSCSWCIAGKASSIPGATLESACSDCPAGTYAAEGSTVCTQCTPGTYANSTASSSCSDCPEQAMMCLSIVPEPPTVVDMQVLRGRKSCEGSNGMGWRCSHGECDCYGCKPGQEMIKANVVKCFESDKDIGFANYTEPVTTAPNVTQCKNGATHEHHLCECLSSQGRAECPRGECACYKCSDEDHLEWHGDEGWRCLSCPRGEYECTHDHESGHGQCGCYECSNPNHRPKRLEDETFCLSGVDDTKRSTESRQTDCLEGEHTHQVCRNTIDSANKACASTGSTLIMSNATLLQAMAPGGVLEADIWTGSWIGAKEKENERGSYVFLDGSELSRDHPAWSEPPHASNPEQPALCVAYWPGHGLFVMDCNFDLSWFGSHQTVCENGQKANICECYKCPGEGGRDQYLRQRARPCVEKNTDWSCKAILWEHCGTPAEGWPALGVGNYQRGQLEERGFRINGVSSLTMYGEADCQVTLFDDDNFQGERHTYYKRDFPDGECKDVWSDRTDSIKVHRPSGLFKLVQANDQTRAIVWNEVSRQDFSPEDHPRPNGYIKYQYM